MSTPQSQFHNHDIPSSDEETDPMKSLLSPQTTTPASVAASGDPHFRQHHLTSLNADVIIRQLPSEGLSFQLWPAATTLFSLLDARHEALLSLLRPGRRTRILELGSGTGLVGIAAAAVLGADVTVTDLPHVIPNLEFNVAANAGVIATNGGAVTAAALRWGDVDQMGVVGRGYDVLVGSDLVYDDDIFEPLLETLKYFLVGNKNKENNSNAKEKEEEEEEEEVVFLMAHLKRWKKQRVFFKKAKKLFEVDEIHRESPDDGRRVGVTVYRFVAKHKH